MDLELNVNHTHDWFVEAIDLIRIAASWEGEFDESKIHLTNSEDHLPQSIEEIDEKFPDVLNFKKQILKEAVPLFTGNTFWEEISHTEQAGIFPSGYSYLMSWAMGTDHKTIDDIDYETFLRMHLETFREIFNHVGQTDKQFDSLPKKHFGESRWVDDVHYELSDVFRLVDHTPFSENKKYKILRIYSNPKVIFENFKEKIKQCEEIVKNYIHLVKDRFKTETQAFDENQQKINKLIEALKFSRMDTKVLEELPKKLDFYINCVSYFNWTLRVNDQEHLRSRIHVGLLSLDLYDYSKERQQSKEHIIAQCKALGDKRRFEILMILSERPYFVRELAEKIDLSSASLSHHLSILNETGFLETQYDERKTYYSIKEETFERLGNYLTKIV